jgi:hypothetical protein
MNQEPNSEAAKTVQTTSAPAVDLPRLARPVYKSDRTEGRKPPADAVHLKTRYAKGEARADNAATTPPTTL